MSLSKLVVAVLSLTNPDTCSEARILTEEIARARDLNVPIVNVFEAVDFEPMWVQLTGIIYSNPHIPPAAIGTMNEAACRGN